MREPINQISTPAPDEKPLPEYGFWRTIFNHLRSWAAEYTVLPLAILSVLASAQFYYILTGRRPEENLTWLLNFSDRAIAIAIAITFTAVARQSFGHWYSKDELLNRPTLAIAHGAKSVVIFLSCLYVLTH